MQENFHELIEKLKIENNLDEIEKLCNEKLIDEIDRVALRGLEYVYQTREESEKEKHILKRLLKVELKKANIYLRMIELCDDKEELTEKAIEELINEKRDEKATELFEKLVDDGWDKKDKIFDWASKLRDNGKTKTGFKWLKRSIIKLIDEKKWFDVEKFCLLAWTLNPGDDIRKFLINSEKNIHVNSPHLDFFLEDLNMYSRKDLIKGIKKLKSILQFDQGKYVLHDSWGVGKIQELNPFLNEIVVNFKGKKGHVVSMDNVDNILEPLADDHWFVQIRVKNEVLREMLKTDPIEVIKIYLRSFPNPIFGTDIKNSISEDLKTDKKWWIVSRSKIKKDHYIDIASGGKGGKFSIREKPRSSDDKILSLLKSANDISKQIEIIYNLASSIRKGDIKTEVVDYISLVVGRNLMKLKEEIEKMSTLKKANKDKYLRNSVLFIKYYFLVKDVLKNIHIQVIDYDLENYFKNFISSKSDENIVAILGEIYKYDLRNKFIKYIMLLPIFSEHLHEMILMSHSSGFRDCLTEKTKNNDVNYILFKKPNDSSDALLWAIDQVVRKKVILDQSDISFATFVEWLFKIVEQALSEDINENRRIITKARDILKKNNYQIVEKAIKGTSLAQARLILSWIGNYSVFNSVQKRELRTRLIRLRPDLIAKAEDKNNQEETIYVTAEAYFKRQNLRDELMKVELPAIVKEISRAAAMGDLSENFEYVSARNKHREITNKIKKIDEELSKVRVVDISNINLEKVSIGTMIGLVENGNPITLTILGPWDSDPERGVISYLSPLGVSFIGKIVGDEIIYHDIKYIIKSIDIAPQLTDNRKEDRRKLLGEDEFKNLVEKGKVIPEDKRSFEERREDK